MEGSGLGYGGTKKKRKKAERKGLRTVFYYLFRNCSFLSFSTISSMGVVCKTTPTIHDLPGSAIEIFFYNFSLFHLSFLCTSSVCDALQGGDGDGDLFVRFAFPVPRGCGLTQLTPLPFTWMLSSIVGLRHLPPRLPAHV